MHYIISVLPTCAISDKTHTNSNRCEDKPQKTNDSNEATAQTLLSIIPTDWLLEQALLHVDVRALIMLFSALSCITMSHSNAYLSLLFSW